MKHASRIHWVALAVALVASPLIGQVASAAVSCLEYLSMIEMAKCEANATLMLREGMAFPDDRVAQWLSAGKCPQGGQYTAGAAGQMPSCSKHGPLSQKEYVAWLKEYADLAEKAGSSDHSGMAWYALAKHYGHPKSADHDMAKAIQCAEKAAAVGYAPAQFMMSYSYLNGFGVQKDEAKGMKLLQAAAAQGFKPAVDQLQKTAAPAATQPATTDGTTKPDQPAAQSPAERLKAAKKLLDDGLITQEEYEATRKRIVGEL